MTPLRILIMSVTYILESDYLILAVIAGVQENGDGTLKDLSLDEAGDCGMI